MLYVNFINIIVIKNYIFIVPMMKLIQTKILIFNVTKQNIKDQFDKRDKFFRLIWDFCL